MNTDENQSTNQYPLAESNGLKLTNTHLHTSMIQTYLYTKSACSPHLQIQINARAHAHTLRFKESNCMLVKIVVEMMSSKVETAMIQQEVGGCGKCKVDGYVGNF